MRQKQPYAAKQALVISADLDYEAVAKPVADFLRAHDQRMPWLPFLLPGLTALGFMLWYRKELRERLALDALIEYVGARTWKRPRPSATNFTILIAHFVNDTADHENEKLIERDLREIPGIKAIRCRRTIGTEDYAKGHLQARRLLDEIGADAMLWGERLTRGNLSEIRACWTLRTDAGVDLTAKRYGQRGADDINLPGLFQEDLTATLSMLAITQSAVLLQLHGTYFADRLRPFAERVEALLARDRREGANWGILMFVVGCAKMYIGAQDANNGELQAAITYFDEALNRVGSDGPAILRGTICYSKGNALSKLGERESSALHLKEAVVAYRTALRAYPDGDVSERAAAQQCLAQTYYKLGLRELSSRRLAHGLQLCRNQLATAPAGVRPGVSAALQSTSGDILAELGDRNGDPALMRQAISAYEVALTVRTRERLPLEWAETRNNLGVAQARLAALTSDAGDLEAAAAHLQAALSAYPREQVPLEYASVLNNLGKVYATMAAALKQPAYYARAVTAYRSALEERTRERAPLPWARTQMNLGVALAAIGEQETGTDSLVQAVAAYRSALLEQNAQNMPAEYYATQYHLGQALQQIGVRGQDRAMLDAALAAYDEASVHPLPPAGFLSSVQHGRGYALQMLGEMDGDVTLLRRAVAAYRLAVAAGTLSAKERSLANLGQTLQILGDKESDTADLRAAAIAFREALALDPPATPPERRASKLGLLGYILFSIGIRDQDQAAVAEAAAVYREAAALPAQNIGTAKRSAILLGLIDALTVLGGVRSEAPLLHEAEDWCRTAAQECGSGAQPEIAPRRARLARALHQIEIPE